MCGTTKKNFEFFFIYKNIVWDELLKENKVFFEAYSRRRMLTSNVLNSKFINIKSRDFFIKL
ncbi:hypothetical protein Hanom_Chr07g00583611 [Helianthus anomalus]